MQGKARPAKQTTRPRNGPTKGVKAAESQDYAGSRKAVKRKALSEKAGGIDEGRQGNEEGKPMATMKGMHETTRRKEG